MFATFALTPKRLFPKGRKEKKRYHEIKTKLAAMLIFCVNTRGIVTAA